MIKIQKIGQIGITGKIKIIAEILYDQQIHTRTMTIETDDTLENIPPEFAAFMVMPTAVFYGHDIDLTELHVDPIFASNLQNYMKRIVLFSCGLELFEPSSYTWLKEFKKALHLVHPIYGQFRQIEPVWTKSRIGLMFSGGVDSFYSLTTRKEISDVIFISDMNAPEEKSLKAVRTLFPTIKIHKVHSSTMGAWDRGPDGWFLVSHGCVLYSSGLLFQNNLVEMIVSSDLGTHEAGSGRDIDYLASTSKMRFTTYGLTSKHEKVRTLLTLDEKTKKEVFGHLQVCYVPRVGDFNCCRCSKCVGVMAILREHGAERYSTTFDFNDLEDKIVNMKGDIRFFTSDMIYTIKNTENTGIKNAAKAFLEKNKIDYQEKA